MLIYFSQYYKTFVATEYKPTLILPASNPNIVVSELIYIVVAIEFANNNIIGIKMFF